MEENELTLIKSLTKDEKNRIRYFNRSGKLSVVDTGKGLAFNPKELEQAMKLKYTKRGKTPISITNKDVALCPFATVRNNGKEDNKVVHFLKKGGQKYFNIDTGNLCFKATDLLDRELNDISRYFLIEKEELIDTITKLYQTNVNK